MATLNKMPVQLNKEGIPISEAPGSPVPSWFNLSPVVQGEPAVLSSVSGEQNFRTKIQPKIDAANANITAGTTLKQDMERAKNQGKAGYDILGNKIETPPADGPAEIDG